MLFVKLRRSRFVTGQLRLCVNSCKDLKSTKTLVAAERSAVV